MENKKILAITTYENFKENAEDFKDLFLHKDVLLKLLSQEDFDVMFRAEEEYISKDVEVDLPDDVILTLALEAHKRDITLNDLVNEVLREKLNGG